VAGAAGAGFSASRILNNFAARPMSSSAQRKESAGPRCGSANVFHLSHLGPPKSYSRCLNCGYLHEGTEPPAMCPACAHPQAYYELLGENW
jgi:rubrerythrin